MSKNALLSASGWNPKLHNYHPPLFKVLFLHPQCEVSGYPSRRSRNMDDDIRSVIIIVYVGGPSEWSSPATASVQGLHQAQLCRPHAPAPAPGSVLPPSCGSSRSLILVQVYHEETRGGSTTEREVEKLQWLFNWNLIQTIITRTSEVHSRVNLLSMYSNIKQINRDIGNSQPSHKLQQQSLESFHTSFCFHKTSLLHQLLWQSAVM